MTSLTDRFKSFRYRMKGRLTWWRAPIRSGPLKGYRWCVFTGARYLRGQHGEDENAVLRGAVAAGGVVYDVGAHVGYVALVAAQIVGPQGRVFAFEPLPLNRRFLQTHVDVNGVHNVQVLPYAVSDRNGELLFDVAGGTGRGRIGEGGQLRVETVSLDAMLADGRLPPPDLIKMDVEGAEVLALVGARKLLQEHGPTILLSTHGDAVKRQCEILLQELGYELRYFCERDLVATAGRRTVAPA